MSKFDDTNRGSCWPNKKKRPDKKDPDFTGSINVDGHDYWFDAWRKSPDAKENAPSLSFRVRRKDGKPQAAAQEAVAPASRASMKDALDDEIPFAAEFR
jgi:hypothetical protein